MIKLAVIGDPISHSLSPVIHPAVLNKLGVEHEYISERVLKGELGRFIERVKGENIDGFNITMPHKSDIIPFLDCIDDEAAAYGAVNTVKYTDGKLMGYCTDANGYLMSLKEAGYGLKDMSILLIGAGGAAGTIVSKALREGAQEITILNRSAEKARQICRFENAGETTRLNCDTLSDENIRKYGSNIDIFINATPLGMKGVDKDFESLDFLSFFPKKALISDLIYNPKRTRLLETAEIRGFKVINGMGMLICQALLSDQIYTDMKFDCIEMRKYVETLLYK